MASNCPHSMTRCNPGCKVWDEEAGKCGIVSGPAKIAAAIEKQTAAINKLLAAKVGGKE